MCLWLCVLEIRNPGSRIDSIAVSELQARSCTDYSRPVPLAEALPRTFTGVRSRSAPGPARQSAESAARAETRQLERHDRRCLTLSTELEHAETQTGELSIINTPLETNSYSAKDVIRPPRLHGGAWTLEAAMSAGSVT
eukprot:3234528-Prymnesium_polylepis.1